MAANYASKQTNGFKNHLTNIAIVGAGGRSGRYMVEYLLKTGKHKVTAISRGSSEIDVPTGVEIKKVDYENQSTLVEALRGQDALIVTLAGFAPENTQFKLIDAAATANVRYILPNEWGYDMQNSGLAKDIMNIGEKKFAIHRHIEKLGKSSWIGVSCGFWYEFSLGGSPARYGFDFANQSLIMFDDGNTHMNTSTWPQVGRAVANLLSMKVLPENESDKEATLEQFKNSYIYISSFNVSQNDMFDSVLRVTGTSKSDWKITHEETPERFAKAGEKMKSGDLVGFVELMYTRVLFQDGSGDFEKSRGLQNEILGLPKEDLDEHTKGAIEYSKLDSPGK